MLESSSAASLQTSNETAAARAPRVALLGKPNCGKTALFNALTGARQKVANYAGVTVERRVGRFLGGSQAVEVVDLPGAYGLEPRGLDERVTRDVLRGDMPGEAPPDLILCVVDATNLRTHLALVLEAKALGRPMAVVLNMMDMAERDGLTLDVAALERELGLPVIPTTATRRAGRAALVDALSSGDLFRKAHAQASRVQDAAGEGVHAAARRAASQTITHEGALSRWTRRLDAVVLHPIAGPVLLGLIMFLMFQAVFSWAVAPMDAIDAGVARLQGLVATVVPDGVFRGFLNEGVIAGVGSVVIFLPQILILFAFVITLEQSGYLPRAAFMLDRLMGRFGLSGAAFIPLLSSFACAIPGIMAARTIEDEKDRLTTILVAPLMTCSARLPVYTLIIAAFIPPTSVGVFNAQGLVMFALYLAGIGAAGVVALALKRTATKGARMPLLAEMPKYQRPLARDLAIGLMQRAGIFLRRAGTVILAAVIILWALLSLPPEAAAADVRNSFAGLIGRGLEVVFAPIGFTWEIAIALIPGLAAREVAIGALGTIYAISGGEENASGMIATLQGAWSLPTALSFLTWFIFAPQCLSTFAAARRETNGWKWPLFMFGYLFLLAYVSSGVVYWIARALT